MTNEITTQTSLSPQALQAVIERQDVARAIYKQRAIADVMQLREAVVKHLHTTSTPYTQPVKALLANRRKHLRHFACLFQEMLDRNSPNLQMRAFVRNLEIAGQLGWSLRDFCERPSIYDPSFSTPDDVLIPFFRLIFQDRQAGLLQRWMGALDAFVGASSRTNLAAMDRVASTQQRPVRKDVVLVGGSALTSLVASILGAYFHVTVIAPHGLGRPWRDRPIFINSSSTVKDVNAPALPLLGGPTTRIIGSHQLNSLDVSVLLGSDTLQVQCDDTSSIEYTSGFRLGCLVATNILWHADDYILGHTVEMSGIQQTADGHLRIPLIAEDGTTRELDASALFLLTGPGTECTAVTDTQTQTLYHQMSRQVDVAIEQVQQRTGWYQEALHKLEPDASRCWTEVQWLRAKRDEQKVELPRILTLSGIEKLYRHWLNNGSNPAQFPLTELMCKATEVGYVGAGDTSRTVKELLEKRGPREAYPPDLEAILSYGTIYNEMATSPEDYDFRNRRRYRGGYDQSSLAIPYKVIAYQVGENGAEGEVRVAYVDDFGTINTASHDFLIDATGIDRRPIEALLSETLAIRAIRDLEGMVVARGNPDIGLYISGSATQFRARDLPVELQRIIQILGIPENTISLWVHGALAERNALSYVASHLPTKWGVGRRPCDVRKGARR